jgi:hypothetical protein
MPRDFCCEFELSAVAAHVWRAVALLVERRLQAKNDLASHRPQRTPGSLRDLPVQLFIAADSKLAAACRFLLGHQSPPHGANTLRR